MDEMTAERVLAILTALSMNQTEAAEAFEVDARTVRRWVREGVPRGPSRVALRLMQPPPVAKSRPR